jgi:ribosomal protein S18 acetylase RimI-like enzyme
MITYRRIDKNEFDSYDKVPMVVHIKSKFVIKKIDRGLGGFLFEEVPVEEYSKDFTRFEKAMDYEKHFNISGWAFFMAFDEDEPIGAVTVSARNSSCDILDKRDDICALWDIRVAKGYKHSGIGQHLFDMARAWATEEGFSQMKIECQNTNVPACRFYHKQGAQLCRIDEYAYYSEYYNEKDIRDEIGLIWYLDLK